MNRSDFLQAAKDAGLDSATAAKAAFDWEKQNGPFEPLKIVSEKEWEPSEAKMLQDPAYAAQRVRKGQRQAYRAPSQEPNKFGPGFSPLRFIGGEPMERFVGGMGRFAYGAIPGVGNKEEMAFFDDVSQGDLATFAGRMAPEIGIAMAGGSALSGATGAGNIANAGLRSLAQGAAYGLPSTALHQSQSLAEGEGFQPAEAATEMALSTALPYVGNLAGRYLQRQGPQILQTALKPGTKLRAPRSVNPIDPEYVLEHNLQPYFGGLPAGHQRIAEASRATGRTQTDILAQASRTGGRAVDIEGQVIPNVRNVLTRRLRDPGNRLSATMRSEAEAALTDLTTEFRNKMTAIDPRWQQRHALRGQGGKFTGQFSGGNATATEARTFRQIVDDKVKEWKSGEGGLKSGQDLAARTLRRELNRAIDRVAPASRAVRQQEAALTPLEQAYQERASQAANNFRMGLLDVGAMGAGGTIGGLAGMAHGNPEWALLAAPLAFAGRRLTSTPGGAAMLYDLGRSATNPSTLRDILAQFARSGMAESDILK